MVISVKGRGEGAENQDHDRLPSLWSFNRMSDMRKDGTAEGMTGSLITLSHVLITSPLSPSLLSRSVASKLLIVSFCSSFAHMISLFSRLIIIITLITRLPPL